MNFLLGFVVSCVLAAALVPLVKRLAIRIGAVDEVSTEQRKIHTRSIPRAGGLAIYGAFVVICFALIPTIPRQFWGLLAAGTIVLLVGLFDDIFRLGPWLKLVGQITAALVAILGFGISIEVVSNPFGNAFNLSGAQQSLHLFGSTIGLSALLLSVIWLVGMTNTINFLDGIDGLSGGVAGIAAVIMFFLSSSVRVGQPVTALVAIVLAGACLGYLFYNFYPAKIFNGDSGAYFLGMTLGILAIFSGAKLATALLVLGLPILDAVWAVVRRLAHGKSPFSADRGHLHHLLLDVGLSQRQVVLVIYAFSVIFGSVALFASSGQKVMAIASLCIILIFLIGILGAIKTRRAKKLVS